MQDVSIVSTFGVLLRPSETLSNGPGASHRFDKAHTERMGTRGDASAHDTNGLATRSQRLATSDYRALYGLCRPLSATKALRAKKPCLEKLIPAYTSSAITGRPSSAAAFNTCPQSGRRLEKSWNRMKSEDLGSLLFMFFPSSGSSFEQPLLGVREGRQSRKGLKGCWSASRRCCHPWRKVEASCPDFRSRLAERGWHKMLKVSHFKAKCCNSPIRT